MSWNAVLQITGLQHSTWSSRCRRMTVAGLPAPARISIVSLDPTADARASELDREIERRLAAGGPTHHCGPARLSGCMTESEPACLHVLVLVISAAACPLASEVETLAADWQRMAPGRTRVIPVLLPPAVFANAVPPTLRRPTLSRCAATTWSTASQIAGLVLEVALIGERADAFVSYVRSEASPAADSLHDALTQRGYRVFLDRFTGTPGRLFPQEIAEEMAEMGVVIALETPSLLTARWTRWEIAFARLYGLGLLALNFAGAPAIAGVSRRHPMPLPATAPLAGAALTDAVDFILRHRPIAALQRRAMYQAIVDAAARNGGGASRPTINAAQLITNAAGNDKAVVLAAGRPGRLRDVRLLEDARPPGMATAVLAGQHAHLPFAARTDVTWLAGRTAIELRGRSDIYRRVRAIARQP